MEMKNVEVGKVFKNWGALCGALGVKTKSSGYRVKQEKEFRCYFNWIKEGRKIIITEVYEEPKEKEDGRRTGNSMKGTNEYEIIGDIVEMKVSYNEQEYICIFDLEDLDVVLQDRRYNVSSDKHVRSVYGNSIHRIIMGLPKVGGRVKKDTLVVHHINCNPLDNRKCNLQVMTSGEHQKLHHELDRKQGKQRGWQAVWKKLDPEFETLKEDIKQVLLEANINLEDKTTARVMRKLLDEARKEDENRAPKDMKEGEYGETE